MAPPGASEGTGQNPIRYRRNIIPCGVDGARLGGVEVCRAESDNAAAQPGLGEREKRSPVKGLRTSLNHKVGAFS
jgi:hypothetical protein